MAERAKIEPFWARTARGKRRASPELAVPLRAAQPEAATPADAPQAPSFALERRQSREIVGAPASDAAPARDADGWIRLSAAAAARHPLFGVKGWLVLVAIFVALGLFRAIVEIFDFWRTTDHGGLAAWIMAVLRSGMALWAALILALLLARSRIFPASFAAYGMVNIVYVILFGLAFAHVTHGQVFVGVAVDIAASLLAIAYVLRSRRVGVTYRRRLRAEGAAASAPAAAGETVQPSRA